MAHVEKRGPKRYMAVWLDPDGRKRSKSFPRKVDADRFLSVTTASILKREWVDPDAGRVTFAEYAELWLTVRDVRETTRRKYRMDVKRAGTLGGVPLGRITPAIVEQWQASALRRLAKSTVMTTRATYGAIFASAVRDRLIVSNPFGELASIRDDRKRVKLLTREQILAVRAGMTAWYVAAVDVGRYCGLRPGEIFGLAADRIDFKAKVIHVDQQLIYTAARGLHMGPPKTAASVRTVPMTRAVSESLAAHMLRYGVSDDGLIFHTKRGAPVSATIRADAWRRVGPAGSRWHDLRHFAASAQIEQGATVLDVMAFLGHATAKETTDTYGHLWPGSEDRTRARMDAVWAVKPAKKVAEES